MFLLYRKKRIYVYAVCTNMIRTIYIYNQIRITIYFTLDHIVVKQRGSVAPRYTRLVEYFILLYFIYQFYFIFQFNNTFKYYPDGLHIFF